MEPLTLSALATLTFKVTSVIKYLTARDWSSALTQAVAWVAGIVVAFLAANADVTSAIQPIPGYPLDTMDNWSLVLVGLGLASLASTIYDVKSAIDGSDSAKEPTLGGGG
jgi:hypothetical protein